MSSVKNALLNTVLVFCLLIIRQVAFAAELVNPDDPSVALNTNGKGTESSVVKTGTPNETGYCKECEERAAAALAAMGDACADPLKQFTCNKTPGGATMPSAHGDDGVK